MANPTDLTDRAAGLAALSICESMLLAFSDLEIIGKKEVNGVLLDAAAAHRGAAGSTGETVALDREVVAIIDRIIAGRNSIPR